MPFKKMKNFADENAEVLAKLELKEKNLRRKLQPEKLSEENFVQLLNLATKIDLVSQACQYSVQRMVDERSMKASRYDNSRRISPTLGELIAIGGERITLIGVLALGVVAAKVICFDIPFATARYLFGKSKEMVRTFKTSYKNDNGVGKFGRAIRRAIEYPIFRVPLVNKMRRDIHFDGTLNEREDFKHKLKEKRKKYALGVMKKLREPLAWIVGICGGGAFLNSLGDGFSAVLSSTGTGILWGVGISTAIAASIYACYLTSVIESKDIRGRLLVEQALNYPPVKDERREGVLVERILSSISVKEPENVQPKDSAVKLKHQSKNEVNPNNVLKETLKVQSGDISQNSDLDKNQSRLSITINKKNYQKKEKVSKKKMVSIDKSQAVRD